MHDGSAPLSEILDFGAGEALPDVTATDGSGFRERELRARIGAFKAGDQLSRDDAHRRGG
jgi:hypothetical protein